MLIIDWVELEILWVGQGKIVRERNQNPYINNEYLY